MQSDLNTSYPDLDIRILGINGIGLEAGNAAISSGRDIPWLQDMPDSDVRTSWDVDHRDVVIVDSESVPIGVFNLTQHDLHEPANYDSLRELLIESASVPEPGALVLVGLVGLVGLGLLAMTGLRQSA